VSAAAAAPEGAPLRVLVVDDERLARAGLRRLLEALPGLRVVGEADGAEAALEAVRTLAPDVLLLDVQMPGRDGFSVLEALAPAPGAPRPSVVFVTAHDAYAVRAFEVNALDYLLKPVRPERLAEAVERVRAARSAPAAPATLAEAPAAPAGAPSPAEDVRPLRLEDRLLLTFRGRAQFVPVAAVSCIRAADDYCELFLEDGRSALVLSSMRGWEARLPPGEFVRVHRSTILRFGAVEEMEPWSSGGFQVRLKGLSAPVTVSRRYASELRARLKP
jgi:two-component system LytT family response regulator